MALAALRVPFSNFCSNITKKSKNKILSGTATGNVLSKSSVIRIQSAGIAGRILRESRPQEPKPAPFPYMEKRFTEWHGWFDDTTKRFDENTKLIIVEGNIAAGKSKFAKELADDLGMLYVPEACGDLIYINEYGFDTRKMDDQLPEPMRSFEVKHFLQNPRHKSVARFQLEMYEYRYKQYIDALAHVLNTGQGVVMDRCVMSENLFVEAMLKFNFISPQAHGLYYEIRAVTIEELMFPHLVIYLDVPVPVIQQRIKERNLPYETNSPALTDEYIRFLETLYKQKYLRQMGEKSEILVYDWSEYGDIEVVVEDLERIDFDRHEQYDKMLRDWRKEFYWEWGEVRNRYTNQKHRMMQNFNVPNFGVPELMLTIEEAAQFEKVWWGKTPGHIFSRGYNPDLGDSVLWKDDRPRENTISVPSRSTT